MVAEHLTGREVLSAGGHRAHVDSLGAQRVHTNAIAEQRAACPATRWVDGENRDRHLGKARQEAIQQFVGHTALASAAGTRDSHDGHLPCLHLPFLAQSGELCLIEDTLFKSRDSRRHRLLPQVRRLPAVPDSDAALRRPRDEILDHFSRPSSMPSCGW